MRLSNRAPSNAQIKPLLERLASMGLTLGPAKSPIDPATMENAMQYSIQARMAPQWNKVQ